MPRVLSSCGLDENGSICVCPRQPFDFVEQHRLADPSKAREEHALLGPLLLDPPEKNACLLKNRVSPHELGERRTGTGRKGILDGIHDPTYTR